MNESLMYLKKLEAVGVPRAQAEVTVEIMTDIIDKNLATKQDLAHLESTTSREFAAVRSEMSQEFAAVRSEMSLGFQQVKSDLERMQDKITIRLGMMLVVVVGALAALQKLG